MQKGEGTGRLTTRRYADEEEADAVRLVSQLRKELGIDQEMVTAIGTDTCGSGSGRRYVGIMRIEELHAVPQPLGRRNRRPSPAR